MAVDGTTASASSIDDLSQAIEDISHLDPVAETRVDVVQSSFDLALFAWQSMWWLFMSMWCRLVFNKLFQNHECKILFPRTISRLFGLRLQLLDQWRDVV